MPFVDDMLRGLQIQIDAFWYNLLLMAASLHWGALRAAILAGYTIELVNRWLAENAFAPLIGQTAASLETAFNLTFAIAMLVLGLTYLLAAFFRLNVVEPRSAILWYIAGALFFSAGPSLYTGMNTLRSTIADALYTSTLTGLQATSGSAFSSLSSVTSDGVGILSPCDNFGPYLGGSGGVDGLDVALAYLRADGVDVMGYGSSCGFHYPSGTGGVVGPVPTEWEQPGSFFDNTRQAILYPILTDEERAESIRLASASHGRLLTAWPLVLFGVAEQGVYLLLTVAQGLTFTSFGVAILFAFFKRTEAIARSVIDQWIELIVQTVVISIVQALVVAFFLAGAATGSGVVVLGVGIVCLLFITIVLWSGIRAVWNSVNRLFGALGQATGGTVASPGAVASGAATGAAVGAAAAVSVGSGALMGMAALRGGATIAQAAGVSMGGSQTLSGAARTLAYLPGVRSTSLGEGAEQFTEGSITRQVARNVPVVGRVAGPAVGAALLSNRDPDQAEYDEAGRVVSRPMLVPAVGEGLAAWTVPRGANQARPATSSTYIEAADGEMLPLAPPARRRMGTFTPDADALVSEARDDQRQQRSDTARELADEEMEQHLTGLTQNAMANDTGDNQRLSQAADDLSRAAQTMVGSLRVSGVPNVAGAVADVVGQVQGERQSSGQPPTAGVDHLQVADRLARVLGVTPQPDAGAPVQRDLARFGLFVDQALQLGLSPGQTERVVREVQASPEGRMQPETREQLDRQVQTTQGVSWLRARDQVDRLEHSAGLLPSEITAYGAVTVQPDVQVNVQVPPQPDNSYDAAMQKQSALGGSGNVTGGPNA